MIDMATRALLSLGCFLTVGAVLMLPFTEQGSSERIVDVLAIVLGLGTLAGTVAVRALTTRRRHRDDAMTGPIDDVVVTSKENP